MKKNVLLFSGLIVIFLSSGITTQVFALTRDEIPSEYKWDFTDAYPGWEEWENDYILAEGLIRQCENHKDRLNPDSPDSLVKFLELKDRTEKLITRINQYASLQASVDINNDAIRSKDLRANALKVNFDKAIAWFVPDLLSLGKQRVFFWLDTIPELSTWSFEIRNEFRLAPHSKNKENESILSLATDVLSASQKTYFALAGNDLPYPEITLSDGSKKRATYGLYNLLESSQIRNDRVKAFDGYYGTFKEFEGTFAETYNGMLDASLFETQVRNYISTAERIMSADSIPVEIHSILVSSAKNGSAPLRRYYTLKKQVLNLETFEYCDIVAPLVDVVPEYPYESVPQNILSAVEILGPEYYANVEKAFSNQWIDVYESDGKWFNAYCSYIEDVHPYILVNYTDNLNGISTVAHEMGHAIHSVFSRQYQPWSTHNYASITAECAANMNELFLIDRLLETAETPEERITILQHLLDSIALTFYRQSMLGDFEMKTHMAKADGKPITAGVLNQMFKKSLEEMYGDSIENLDELSIFWASKPHFYDPFYVHVYAISWTAAISLHKQMTSGDEISKHEARDKFISLLKSGGTDYPIELFNQTGVNLMSETPYQDVVDYMNHLVDQIENELESIGKL